MSILTEITSKDDLTSHLATLSPSTLLVINFYTPWTAFCAPMSAILTGIASQYAVTEPPTLSLVSLNGKELLDISKEYGVRTAPWVVFIRSGQVIESIKGSDPTKIRNAFNVHIGPGTIANPDDRALAPGQSKDALFTRLGELVKAAPVMLFMKGTPKSPRCRFSRRLVDILREHDVSYDFFDILTDEDVREGLKEFADWPTYPQLWANGELVGGLDVVSIPDLSLVANPLF